MTDFELTRRAFSAAFHGAELHEDKDMLHKWFPLSDDGDAFRLAVQMRFAVDINAGHTSIGGILDGQEDMVLEKHGDDPRSATRRAIVRAAAMTAC